MKIIFAGSIYEHITVTDDNPIIGGIGDNLKKYNKKEMEKGISIEKEHIAKNKNLSAKQKRIIEKDIAKDHLKEIPDYYTRLEKMEKEAKAK